MATSKVYLAVDLGATSGRVIACHYEQNQLRLEEIHRFSNEPAVILNSSHWKIGQLFDDILRGLQLAADKFGDRIVSLGVDSWGVDYGLIDATGKLLGIPFAYRDRRTDGYPEKLDALISPRELYAATGLQSMFFNTLYQLHAELQAGGAAIQHAGRLLFIPDLINYWLSGVAANERTIASTSQLYNPSTRDWDRDLIERLGLPKEIFHAIVDPGEILGSIEIGGQPINVVTVGSHDTASAVAGVPLSHPDAAYISSGTWSLVGMESPAPVLDDKAFQINFTNETGVANRIRLLKNVTGMWLMEQSRKQWELELGEDISYDRIDAAALSSRSPGYFVDPDHPTLATPGDMPAKIRAAIPNLPGDQVFDIGDQVRIINESLALKYRYVIESLEQLTGKTVPAVHIVGGGARNGFLNQCVADVIGKKVIAGPAEAASMGNALVQLIADGEIGNIEEGRRLIAASVELTSFEPSDDSTDWNAIYAQFTADNRLAG